MLTKFKLNEQVVHPKHGVGCIGRLEEVDGQTGRFLMIAFPRTTLTLRIPEANLGRSGLRRLSSAPEMRSALSVLPDPPVAPQGHWSRYAAECGEKLNSGEPKLLAEIVRDLNRRGRSGWGARLYREAVLRLAEELALVEGIEIDQAQAMIEAQLPAAERTDKKVRTPG